MPGSGFVFAAFEYACMTTKEIIQYTSVHFTIYPSPYSCMSRWYYYRQQGYTRNYVLRNITVVMLEYDWWLCMVINISVQYNGGASPRHYTVDPRSLPVGNPFKYHVVALYI